LKRGSAKLPIPCHTTVEKVQAEEAKTLA